MIKTNESKHIQLLPFLLSRKNFYQFLYCLFMEPINEEILLTLASSGNFSELKEFHEGGRILTPYFEQLTEAQISLERDEYHRLFIGPGSLAAPPWESYYRSNENLLFEKWTLEIRNQYHQFGLKFIKENNEPDDHLLLELEFMIFLVDLNLKSTSPERIEELISSQIHFLKEHLTVWIPAFCKRIIACTNSQLFLGAAMLLEDFLNFDLTSLLEVKEALADV